MIGDASKPWVGKCLEYLLTCGANSMGETSLQITSKNFGKMQRTGFRVLCDLLTTAETIGNDQCPRLCPANSR